MATTLSMGRFKPADHYNNNWSAALEDSQSLEDALNPAFWSHNARFMRAGDMIRLIPERGDYYAQLIVINAGKAFAQVKLLAYVPLLPGAEGYEEDTSVPLPLEMPLIDDLYVDWKGPAVRYSVIRRTDGERIRDHFQTKEEAEQWMRDHVGALGR